jgi:hypothetical protein
MTVGNTKGSFPLEHIDIIAGEIKFLFLADHIAGESATWRFTLHLQKNKPVSTDEQDLILSAGPLG